jgi:hypothetical protein
LAKQAFECSAKIFENCHFRSLSAVPPSYT